MHWSKLQKETTFFKMELYIFFSVYKNIKIIEKNFFFKDL